MGGVKPIWPEPSYQANKANAGIADCVLVAMGIGDADGIRSLVKEAIMLALHGYQKHSE